MNGRQGLGPRGPIVLFVIVVLAILGLAPLIPGWYRSIRAAQQVEDDRTSMPEKVKEIFPTVDIDLDNDTHSEFERRFGPGHEVGWTNSGNLSSDLAWFCGYYPEHKQGHNLHCPMQFKFFTATISSFSRFPEKDRIYTAIFFREFTGSVFGVRLHDSDALSRLQQKAGTRWEFHNTPSEGSWRFQRKGYTYR
jgi:hypothetical protein